MSSMSGTDANVLTMQAYDTLTQLIYDNAFQQGASRGTVEAMTADDSQDWTLYLLNGDVSYARCVSPSPNGSDGHQTCIVV